MNKRDHATKKSNKAVYNVKCTVEPCVAKESFV